jgi:hypothetical protein
MRDNELTFEQRQIIDGILISDGYIASKSKVACSLRIGQRGDKEEFVKYIAKRLGLEHSIGYYCYVPKNGKKPSPECRYSSKSYASLLEIENRWYRNGKKRVPDDFIMDRDSLLFWYIGDGNLHTGISCYPRLSTCCFAQDELQLIVEKFLLLGIHCSISSRNEIYIRVQSTKIFFDVIGPCPTQCYQYKWPSFIPVHSRRLREEEKEQMIKMYCDDGLVSAEIANFFGVSQVATSRVLRLGIDPEKYKQLKSKNLRDRGLASQCNNAKLYSFRV